MDFKVLITILIILISFLIRKLYKIYSYWSDRGIKYVRPLPLVGNVLPNLLKKLSMGELHLKICEKFENEPVCGIYNFINPSLIVKDADYVEKVLIKDFSHFTDRSVGINEKANPLDANLFTLTGSRWRALRIKLTPTFTTGKLKGMLQPMSECGMNMLEYINQNSLIDVDLKEMSGMFASDIIGSVVFGIDAKELSRPDTKFRKMAKKFFTFTRFRFLKFLLITNFPKIARFFHLSIRDKDITDYFENVVRQTIAHRINNNYSRNDFTQLLLQLKEKGTVDIQSKDVDDSYLYSEDTKNMPMETVELTDSMLVGQALIFFTAGFETTASAMMYTLYELTQNKEAYDKVCSEIRQENGELTYGVLKKMTYLDQCVKENLRMHSPLQVTIRICTKSYTFENGLTVEPGLTISIPIIAIHRNPKYFPEPEKFKPERFDPEKNTIKPCTYLPFGDGPRICIAMRFAMMEIKLGLAILLKNYDITLSNKTKLPIKINPISFLTQPLNPILFNMKRLN